MSREIEKNTAPQLLHSRMLFLGMVLLIFTGFIGLDVLTPCCFDDAWPAIFLMTLMVGQLTLICVWGTLVEGTFWIRLPWTILLLVVSWGAICFGVQLNEGRIESAEIVGMGLVWFYGFAISYVPLKIAAWLFGWRITLPNRRDENVDSSRYSIRDLMLGTTILAMTLAVGRQFVPGQWPQWSDIWQASGLNNPEMLFAFVLFSIVSLAVKLPCIWIALATDKNKVLILSLVWVGCSGLLGLAEMVVVLAVLGEPGSGLFEFLLSMVLGHASMAATMIAVLFGLRCFGYHMSRRVSLAT